MLRQLSAVFSSASRAFQKEKVLILKNSCGVRGEATPFAPSVQDFKEPRVFQKKPEVSLLINIYSSLSINVQLLFVYQSELKQLV